VSLWSPDFPLLAKLTATIQLSSIGYLIDLS